MVGSTLRAFGAPTTALGLALVAVVVWLAPAARAISQTTPPTPSSSPATYAGSETCAQCHYDKFTSYVNQPHSLAGDPRTPAAAFGCESCHGPGSAHVGGGGGRGVGGLMTFARTASTTKTASTTAASTTAANDTCLKCHTRGPTALWHGSTHDARKVTCTDCHLIHGGNQKLLAQPTQQQLCVRCHQQIRQALAKSSHHPLREEKMQCTSCHNPHGTQAPRLVAANSANDKCFECHAEKRGPFLFEHPPVRENRMNCHDPHGSSHKPCCWSRNPLVPAVPLEPVPSQHHVRLDARAEGGGCPGSCAAAAEPLSRLHELPRGCSRQQQPVGQVLALMRSMRPRFERRPIGATIVAVIVLSGLSTAAPGEEAPTPPLATDPGSDQGTGTVETPSQEDVTQAGTLYPPWSLISTRQIDPRVRPNLGKRVLTMYHPIKDGPLLYPTFSPLTPDFRGEQTARPWSLRASTAFFAVDDERASSKLQEYRDLSDGFTAGLEANYRHGNTALNLVGRQLGRDDQDLRLDVGSAGKLQISALYNEIPHRFAFGATSLYGGIGSSHLTIPDSIQADLQNSTSNANLAQKVGAYVSGQGVSIDEELRRKQAGPRWCSWRRSARRPSVVLHRIARWSPALQRVVRLRRVRGTPWPVEYDTRDARVSLEWAKPESRPRRMPPTDIRLSSTTSARSSSTTRSGSATAPRWAARSTPVPSWDG